jgi:hypothetical protein
MQQNHDLIPTKTISMKFNLTTSLLVTTLVILITFFLTFSANEPNKTLLMAGCFLTLSTTLIGAISISFESPRATVLIRITSWVFFIIQLVSQIAFTQADTFHFTTYALIAGGLLIVYALTVYALSAKTR